MRTPRQATATGSGYAKLSQSLICFGELSLLRVDPGPKEYDSVVVGKFIIQGLPDLLGFVDVPEHEQGLRGVEQLLAAEQLPLRITLYQLVGFAQARLRPLLIARQECEIGVAQPPVGKVGVLLLDGRDQFLLARKRGIPVLQMKRAGPLGSNRGQFYVKPCYFFAIPPRYGIL